MIGALALLAMFGALPLEVHASIGAAAVGPLADHAPDSPAGLLLGAGLTLKATSAPGFAVLPELELGMIVNDPWAALGIASVQLGYAFEHARMTVGPMAAFMIIGERDAGDERPRRIPVSTRGFGGFRLA